MKNIKIITIFILTILSVGNAFASKIEKIEAITNNNIELTGSPTVLFSDIKINGDIKLLKDIPVTFSDKDPDDFKKILLNLSTDIMINSSYSLITILGADGNIDFNVGNTLEGEIINSNLNVGDSGIKSITIIDSRTIELNFTNDLIGDVFEFKILSDIIIDSMTSKGDNKLSLNISKNLEPSTAYIIMILSLEDAMGNTIVFTEDLYDYTTPDILVENNILKKDTIVKEDPKIVDKGSLQNIALNAAETPATGSATSVLVILALILNSAFFLRKKFLVK